ncbi:MAG: DNA-protecting protein DprA [Firmicutes bacterium]|nr:DNA-protecting protein DprA [Bacillota bacterium]MDD4336667.1 DNA-protecting protein DprA [Bacillota bacterium]MDD4791639.1 DNA-protecting protein DprA [Bacillota bacterium]
MADRELKLRWEDVPEPEGRELAAWVFWNSVPGFGSRSFLRMLEKYGSAIEGLNAARRGGQPPPYTRRAQWNWAGRVSSPVKLGMDEISRASRISARIIPCPSVLYPAPLRNIHDPPILLYAVGSRGLTEVPWVAMVGSRQATAYGVAIARRYGRLLASAGIGVVSGLARGIDSAAHRGAIEAGGLTVGVLGAGLGDGMTSRLRRLMKEVAASGCVISPFPIGWAACKDTFPARNRIISGMSEACIVVEAAAKSGAKITADFATEQGRCVFAVPGDINRPTSVGANQMLGTQAEPLLDIGEVIDRLVSRGVLAAGDGPIRFSGGILDQVDHAVLDSLTANTSFETIQMELGLPAQRLLTSLTRLEFAGLIDREPGMRYTRRH